MNNGITNQDIFFSNMLGRCMKSEILHVIVPYAADNTKMRRDHCTNNSDKILLLVY